MRDQTDSPEQAREKLVQESSQHSGWTQKVAGTELVAFLCSQPLNLFSHSYIWGC